MSAKLRFFALVSAITVLCAAAVWADPPSQVARLSFLSGAVSFLPGDVDEWTPAVMNYPLTIGDSLWTDDGSRAELHARSGAIRLDSRTDFSFLNLDDQAIQVRVSEGSLNITLRGVDAGTTFEIDTPNATVALDPAGSYRVDVEPGGQTTRVIVRSGIAEVTAGRDVYDVESGRSTVISGLSSIAYYVMDAPDPDEWDSWSTGRDRREDQAASNPRVSREMIGVEDLDENGTWRVDATYGETWTPSHVPADWAPYHFGHWAWVQPWGWTWIDDATWGFAPFHYGRWAFLDARWYWIPGAAMERPVYAPALVVFLGGEGWRPAAGDGIGWFPLAPREAYIPPYKASIEYVQKINVSQVTNINTQNRERFDSNDTVHANRNAPGGVTLMPRQDFVQSRPADRAVFAVSQSEARNAPVMGMTAKIAPQRESIIVKPLAAAPVVLKPPASVVVQRVYSRAAPPPAPVPFAQQQKALIANPGKPVDPVALSGMQRGQQAAAHPVTVVDRTKLVRQNNPPVAQQPVAIAPAPAVQPKPIAPPVAQQPVVIKPAPAMQPKPIAPPPVQPPVVVAPAPAMQQKPIVPPVQQPVVVAPAPAMQPKPVAPAPVARQPVIKPAPAVQQKPVDKAGSSAAALLATLKTRTLPDADQRLSEAKKVAGINLDLNAAAQQLASAKAALADAEKDLAAGSSEKALQKAGALQKQIEDLVNRINAAVQGANEHPQKS